MGIEVRRANAHGVGAFDLRTQLDFNLLRIDFRGGSPVMVEVTIFVEQAADFISGGHRAPADVNAFAGEREMKTEIHFGMRFGVIGDFRKPGAGHHDAG
jgi:hypothetical protein